MRENLELTKVDKYFWMPVAYAVCILFVVCAITGLVVICQKIF